MRKNEAGIVDAESCRTFASLVTKNVCYSLDTLDAVMFGPTLLADKQDDKDAMKSKHYHIGTQKACFLTFIPE